MNGTSNTPETEELNYYGIVGVNSELNAVDVDDGNIDTCESLEDDELMHTVSLLDYNDSQRHERNYEDLYHKLELLSTYLRGQKNVYLFSRNVMNFRQNLLTGVSLLFGVITTVIAFQGLKQEWSDILVSSLNAFLTLLVGLIGYFKFDAQAESFLHLVNRYEKLELYIEISTSQLMAVRGGAEQEAFVLSKIRLIENRIRRIKDDNSCMIPRLVTMIYPILTRLNIFKFIQKKKFLADKGIEESLFEEMYEAEKYKDMWIIWFVPEKAESFERLIKYQLL